MFLSMKTTEAVRACRSCGSRGPGRETFHAAVVRAVRVNGQPRQQVVAVFPAITSCCAATGRGRAVFWFLSEPIIRQLEIMIDNNPQGPAGRFIENQLRAHVPAPSQTDWDALYGEFASARMRRAV